MWCTTCGEQGDCGGTIAKCANCWEVEQRLAKYVRSATGRDFIAETLAAEFKPAPKPMCKYCDGVDWSEHDCTFSRV